MSVPILTTEDARSLVTMRESAEWAEDQDAISAAQVLRVVTEWIFDNAREGQGVDLLRTIQSEMGWGEG